MLDEAAVVRRLGDAVAAEQEAGGGSADITARLAHAAAALTRLGTPDPDAWAAAVLGWERLGDPFWTATARLREAEAAAAAGATARAADALQHAHRLAADLDAAPLLVEIEQVSRRTRLGLDAPTPKVLAAATIDQLGLTPREAEVLTLRGRRPDQPTDRRAPVRVGEDGQRARLQHPAQARCQHPSRRRRGGATPRRHLTAGTSHLRGHTRCDPDPLRSTLMAWPAAPTTGSSPDNDPPVSDETSITGLPVAGNAASRLVGHVPGASDPIRSAPRRPANRRRAARPWSTPSPCTPAEPCPIATGGSPPTPPPSALGTEPVPGPRHADNDGVASNIFTFGSTILALGDGTLAYELTADLATRRRVDLAGAGRGLRPRRRPRPPTAVRCTSSAYGPGNAQTHVTVSAGAMTRATRSLDDTPRVEDLTITRDHVVFLADGLIGVTPPIRHP